MSSERAPNDPVAEIARRSAQRLASGSLPHGPHCASLFPKFPHPSTGPSPQHLTRLTQELGLPALESTWKDVTGNPLPDAVRDFVTS